MTSEARRPLMVINVVGLTSEMLGPLTPNLTRLAQTGFSRPLQTILPAVTCSVQATLLTGLMPSHHGIVGNGWYFRELSEVMFWKQSNHLIEGEKIYQTAKLRSPGHKTAKMFPILKSDACQFWMSELGSSNAKACSKDKFKRKFIHSRQVFHSFMPSTWDYIQLPKLPI